MGISYQRLKKLIIASRLASFICIFIFIFVMTININSSIADMFSYNKYFNLYHFFTLTFLFNKLFIGHPDTLPFWFQVIVLICNVLVYVLFL